VRRLGAREGGANRLARHANERVKAVRDGDSEAGRAVTVQGRKLCAEIAHEERRNRPLSVAIGIVWAKHFDSGLFLFVFIQLER
jgi:hypothetical protein